MPNIAVAPHSVLRLDEEGDSEADIDFNDVVTAAGARAVSVEDADGLIWLSVSDVTGLERHLADHGDHLKWIQLPWAGVEQFGYLLDDKRIWTCAKGAYARPVAEHALAMLLAGLRKLPERVRATTWGGQEGRRLDGCRVVILGGGGIGRAVLDMLSPFEVHTTVVGRTDKEVPGADRSVSIDHLDEVLPQADALVMCLPLTAETTGIVGARQLQLLPDGAWVVNVGRGKHIVTADLVQALTEGRIGGAALDVTEPEPLPDGHPLWSLPNCIITPHSSNTPHMSAPLLAERISENIKRFAQGDSLVGVVDPVLGY